jgi:carbon storage regulator
MLVFTLESGDVFHVGDHIRVRVVSVNGSRVKVGVEAPREVDVDRDKVRRDKLSERDRLANGQ